MSAKEIERVVFAAPHENNEHSRIMGRMQQHMQSQVDAALLVTVRSTQRATLKACLRAVCPYECGDGFPSSRGHGHACGAVWGLIEAAGIDATELVAEIEALGVVRLPRLPAPETESQCG